MIRYRRCVAVRHLNKKFTCLNLRICSLRTGGKDVSGFSIVGMNQRRLGVLGSVALASTVGATAWSAGVPGRTVDEVVVTGTRTSELLGAAESASEGTVLSEQIQNRPVLRTGEVLEVVPGLIITQHSGDGKANQFFLRGFNLDHGTDFASRVEGMPVNMPTHAHGQGYSDINFMIPELIERIEYKKGTYFADEGNFSAAGSVDITYHRTLPQTLTQLTSGEDGYWRGVFATSLPVAQGDLLVGFDTTRADGPWTLDENLRKVNGVVKYARGNEHSGFDLEAMAYDGKWRSTDQVPLRAVEDGLLHRFDNMDPTDGGKTHRYSLSGSWWGDVGPGKIKVLAYGVDYQLDLFSNFTYAIDSEHGDQFEQFDDRRMAGTDARYTQPLSLLGRDGEFSAGVQVRHDDIDPVGLYLTQSRERHATVREDNVRQTSYSAYLSQSLKWTDWLRTEAGVRVDEFRFEVDSNLPANSGNANDDIVSPKFTATFGPWSKTEFFLDWGRGFHSNDAPGATITVDPTDGVTPAEQVTPLVKAVGQEIGVRTAIIPRVQLAASLWQLKLDSELLFVGDGGTTEASRASKRRGVELSAYYSPLDALIIDADIAWSRARFTDSDPAGDRIPNAIERVASIGLAYNTTVGFFGGARLRYLGPGPLIEDNSVRSKSTTLVNVDVGYHFTESLTASLTLLNAFDEKANDVTYFYSSQLPGEAAPVDDIHFHPVEPRQIRATLAARF